MSTQRMATIGRFVLKYRNAGILSGIAGDDPLLADAGDAPAHSSEPEEFVSDLEALGPTFIKIGQALSTRPDLVPAPYIVALERMQDDVAPVNAATMRAIIEEELGVRISKLFESFDDKPIGSASLAQVYGATLRDGRPVAVKVQRPDVAATLREDLDALEKLTGAASLLSKAHGHYGFADWISEFRKTLSGEIDYRREAENLESFARNLKEYPRLVVPEPIWDYSTQRVLTMQRIAGVKVTKISELRRLDPEAKLIELSQDITRAYLDQVFVNGLIHADPHPGNVLLTETNKLALLDLGMVAHIAPRMREQLLKLLLAILDGRGEYAAELFAMLSTRLEDYRETDFFRDTSRLVTEYASSNDPALHSEGKLLLDLTRSATTNGLRPPAELPLLGKTLLNLDAVSSALDPRQETRRTIEGHLQEMLGRNVRQSFSLHRIAGDMLEVQELLHEAPRRLSQALRLIADNRLKVHITGLEEGRLIESMQKIANRITTGIITAGLILGAAMIMRIPSSLTLFGYPALALVFFLIAFLLGVALVTSMFASDRKAKPKEERNPM